VVDSNTNHVFSGRLTETSSQDQNVASRLYESGIVLGKIVERPIFGSGLGALHSPDQPMSPDQNTSTRYYLNPTYVHNFYLWAWFKLGLAGILCFIGLVIAALKAGARAHRSTAAADDKALGLAVVAVMAAIAINSVTSPLFNDEFTVPSIVFVLGLCSATLKLRHQRIRATTYICDNPPNRLSNNMRLSIVLVTYNFAELVTRSLSSILGHTNSNDFEIIIVDNASADGTPDLVSETFPQVRLIRNKVNVGFARAVNQAVSLSSGDSVVLLNSDCFLQNDAFGEMLCYLECIPKSVLWEQDY